MFLKYQHWKTVKGYGKYSESSLLQANLNLSLSPPPPMQYHQFSLTSISYAHLWPVLCEISFPHLQTFFLTKISCRMAHQWRRDNRGFTNRVDIKHYSLNTHWLTLLTKWYVSLQRLAQLYNYCARLLPNAQPYSWHIFLNPSPPQSISTTE